MNKGSFQLVERFFKIKFKNKVTFGAFSGTKFVDNFLNKNCII